MKDKPLRALIIEGSEDDALLLIRELKKGGYNPVYERVKTAAAMKKALKEKYWDVILCDYKMPKFNAPSVIAVLKESDIDIPLIVVTGAIGEETAADCMRLGAQDYIMKDNLSRLCPAIARELEDAKVRNKKKQAESQREAALKLLRESEEKYRLIFEYSPIGLLSFDEKGVIVACNDNFVKFIGSSREKLIGLNMLNLPDKNIVSVVQKALKGSPGFYEGDYSSVTVKKITPVRCLFEPMEVGGGRILGGVGIIEDITERKRTEDALKNSELKYRNIFENAMEGIYQVTIEGRIIMANAAFARMAGYDSPDEFIKSIKDVGTQLYVHPEDRKRFLKIMDAKGFVNGFEVELYKKDGSKFWAAINARTVKDEQEKIIYTEGLVEDITIRKHAEEQLHQTLESLRKSFSTTIQVMVSAVEARDPYTAGHQLRSADLACAIATEMGLARDKIEGVRMAGSIHDIGKLSIPAEILSKPAKLTNIEFSLIKEHSQIGYEMLKNIESPWPLAQIVYQHHERMNGSGYPRNLKGDEIILEARIMAVADVVEAMASHRPYRPTLGIEAALEEIKKNKGILYDVAVADACLRLFREKGYQLP